MKKYYYKHDGHLCLEECPIGLKTKHGDLTLLIGGVFCQECKHYKGGSNIEDYVICKYLQPKRKTNWKKILLRIAAVCTWVHFTFIFPSILRNTNIDFSLGLTIVIGCSLLSLGLTYYLWNLSNKK